MSGLSHLEYCPECGQPPLRVVEVFNRRAGTEEYYPSRMCAKCAAGLNHHLPCIKCNHGVYLPSDCLPNENRCCTGCRSRLAGNRCERCQKTSDVMLYFMHRDLYLPESGGHKIDSWYSARVCPPCFDELTAWASYSKRLAWAIRFFRLAERVVISKEQSEWRMKHRPGRVYSKTDLLRECVSKIIKPNTLAKLRTMDHKAATRYLILTAKTVAVDLYDINERENRYLLMHGKNDTVAEIDFDDSARNKMPWSRSGNSWGFELELLTERLPKLKCLTLAERSIWEQVQFDDRKFNSQYPELNVKAFYPDGKQICKTTAHTMFKRADAIIQPSLKIWHSNWDSVMSHYVCGQTGFRPKHGLLAGLVDANGGKRTVRFGKFGILNRPAWADRVVPQGTWPIENRPTVKRASERVRGKNECINPDCQNGFAVGEDNMILPSNHRGKVKKFFPARTKTNNTLCTGCEVITSTKPARVIEMPVAATLVTITREPLDAMLASSFFGAEPCGNFSAEREYAVPETRNKTIETINTLQIPKIMIAAAVELDSSRISDYLKHRPLAPERVEKIEAAVEKIAFVWNTCAPFRVSIESPELLEQAFDSAQHVSAFRANPDSMPLEAVRL